MTKGDVAVDLCQRWIVNAEHFLFWSAFFTHLFASHLLFWVRLVTKGRWRKREEKLLDLLPSNLLEGQTPYFANPTLPNLPKPNNLSPSKCRPEILWLAVSGWVLHKKSLRRENLKELAAHIHWPLIEADFRSRQVILKSWTFIIVAFSICLILRWWKAACTSI